MSEIVPPFPAKQAKKERQARALRQNLRQRKAQARARGASGAEANNSEGREGAALHANEIGAEGNRGADDELAG